LGAESNGDRSLIAYNITRRPENGTFYWVDGEKEASTFTQVDIDNGEVLYAQMNMNAYQVNEKRHPTVIWLLSVFGNPGRFPVPFFY
jgi:hypothetical protein